MLLPRFAVWMVAFAMMVLGAGLVSGQNYPNKPIRMVAPAIGSNNDFMARLIAQGISGSLGQPIIVDNRPTGVIPGEIVSKAPPDGYTLLVSGTPFLIGPLLRKTPYDPVRDFAPITLAISQPNVLVVHASVPAKSVKELIALAKAKPGELNYNYGSVGGSSHTAGELFKAMAGVKIQGIAYSSSSQEIADLVSGRVQLTFQGGAKVATHIASGKLRALAVTSAEPSALFPGLPTMASSLPSFESVTIIGIFAPAKTPAAVIKQLNQEIVRFLKTTEVKERLLNNGVETVGSSPEEFADKIKSEMTTLGKVIKNAGIRGE